MQHINPVSTSNPAGRVDLKDPGLTLQEINGEVILVTSSLDSSRHFSRRHKGRSLDYLIVRLHFDRRDAGSLPRSSLDEIASTSIDRYPHSAACCPVIETVASAGTFGPDSEILLSVPTGILKG